MSLPPGWRDGIASGLRQTVLLPLLQLQSQSEELRTSRARFVAVTAERDSASLAAAFLPELRAENERLRALLGLGQRLGTGYVPGEVLHQAAATDPLTIVVAAGSARGVRALEPVVAPGGLVGVVSAVEKSTCLVITWAHPDFRASAMAANGTVFGIAAPHGAEGPSDWLLELRGVPYGATVDTGTEIVTSGLGGVLPRGIPIGRVVGELSKTGWERVYLIRPAVHPAEVSHVMVLVGSPSADLQAAFTPVGRGAP